VAITFSEKKRKREGVTKVQQQQQQQAGSNSRSLQNIRSVFFVTFMYNFSLSPPYMFAYLARPSFVSVCLSVCAAVSHSSPKE
jgi:hypothetical protein